MKLIGVLLSILVIPYFILSGLDHTGLLHTDPLWRGRVSLALMLVFTGSAHFWAMQPMTTMLPEWVPMRAALIYGTGVAELAAAAGLLIPSLAHVTAWCLIVFFVAVFPANIYAAVQRTNLAGQGAGPIYLLARAPVQLFLIGWTWWFGIH